MSADVVQFPPDRNINNPDKIVNDATACVTVMACDDGRYLATYDGTDRMGAATLLERAAKLLREAANA